MTALLLSLGPMKKTPSDPVNVDVTILLVDDNPHGLIARRKVLEEQGYQIRTALSAEEALEIFPQQRFDLVVTDFKMLGMTGVELIARIRAISPSVPLILLSGFVEPLGMTEESTGADAVISKTAGEVANLVRTVKRLLTRGVRKPPKKEVGQTQIFMTKSV